jgi:peptidyl-prolyl cis-trans isomerase B (cyclophilin B)
LFFSDEQIQAYTTIGGSHHLNGQYTIFGELTEGFDVLDRIADQPKDAYDRPKKDIRIIQITIE